MMNNKTVATRIQAATYLDWHGYVYRARSPRRMQVAYRRNCEGMDILKRRRHAWQSVSFPLAALPLPHLHGMIRMYQHMLGRLPLDFDDNPGQVSTDGGVTWKPSGLTRAYLVDGLESALAGLRGELARRRTP